MTIENIRKYFKKKLLPHDSRPYVPRKCYELGPSGCIEEQIKALQSKGVTKGSIVPFFYFKATGTVKNLNLELQSEKIVIS